MLYIYSRKNYIGWGPPKAAYIGDVEGDRVRVCYRQCS